MVKDKQRDQSHQEKKLTICLLWADVKFLLCALLIIGVLFTAFQFRPFLSPSNLRSCLTNHSAPEILPKSLKRDELQPSHLVVKRKFNSVGSAAALFVQMGAYRGGLNTFAVVGLASKAIHVFSKPDYRCDWVPRKNRSAAVAATSYWMQPDWGYGRIYTVVVVNCTFEADVGADGSGGQLVVTATSGDGDGGIHNEEKFVALYELPGAVNMSVFSSPPTYDYMYCGSPLYGTLSPQRVREWMAYHAELFGERAHFVIHDAGGVHQEVMEVLRPWIKKGTVTLQDVRDQERFDGYYHNQFLVLNDCLHRYRYMAKWMIFFDLDEFLYVEPPRSKFHWFMESMSGYTQFMIEQMPMSSKLCLSDDLGRTEGMWGIEKLVYKDVKRGIRRDRKYAIQPHNAFSVGVHLSQNFTGKYTYKTEGRIKYFHYHGTIANRGEPCKEFVNATDLWHEGKPYYRDETLRRLAGSIKRFELETIGKSLVGTRQ